MSPFTRMHVLKSAGMGAALALGTFVAPIHATDLPENLGPVPAHHPILKTVGSKRVIAFYIPSGGRCAVNAVVWEKTNPETGMTTAERVRVSLNPGQIVHIDSVEQESLNLQCGPNAESLAAVESDDRVAYGIPSEQTRPVEADMSGFSLTGGK